LKRSSTSERCNFSSLEGQSIDLDSRLFMFPCIFRLLSEKAREWKVLVEGKDRVRERWSESSLGKRVRGSELELISYN
jgi:hypothetical protein